jgi:hypothetical protein
MKDGARVSMLYLTRDLAMDARPHDLLGFASCSPLRSLHPRSQSCSQLYASPSSLQVVAAVVEEVLKALLLQIATRMP